MELNADTLGDWALAYLQNEADSDNEAVPKDTPEHILQRESAKLERRLREMATSFVDSEFDRE